MIGRDSHWRPVQAVVIVSLLLLCGLGSVGAQTVELTDAERQWLADHPIIRIGPAPNFPPVEFFEHDGEFVGISADYAELLQERTSIQFEVSRFSTWSEVVEATRRREVDVWLEAAQTPERDQFMLFSEPYLRLPAVIIVRREIEGALSMEDLIGMRVAVVEGYATQDYLDANHPELELVTVPDVQTGLENVSFGSADAFVANVATSSFYIERAGLLNLRVAGESGFDWHLRMASRNDWPELQTILQKGMDSISEEERREIFRRWILVAADSPVSRVPMIWVIGAALLVGLLFLAGWFAAGRRKSGRDGAPGSLATEWPIAASALVGVIALLVAAGWSRGVLERRVRLSVSNSLQAVLNASTQSVYDWFEEREIEVHRWASRADVKEAVGRVRSLSPDVGPPERDAALAALDAALEPLVDARDRVGYVVLDSDGVVLASNRQSRFAPGSALPVPNGFIDGLSGEGRQTNFCVPRRGDADDASSVPMLVASSMRGRGELAGAILAIEMNPAGEFTRILQRGRIGMSGETYAFNRHAEFVSASRFDRELREVGLIGEDETALLTLAIRDPGGNMLQGHVPSSPTAELPLTRMATSALTGRSAVDAEGYNDYRGVPVIGAWFWDDRIGLGVTTEMDVDEAYESLEIYERQITIGTALAIVLMLSLSGLMLRSRRDMARANAKIHDAYETIKEHSDRMEDELNVGRSIQMSMIPLIFPAFPEHREFSVYALLEPAREVGGDFYDFFFIDEKHFCFAVGDVSGKGVPSALFMAVAKTMVKSRAAADLSTGSILTHVNEELAADNETCMFVTLFVGILDIFTGELVYTSAGHNPPLLRRANGDCEWIAKRHGPVVGALDGMAYGEDHLTLGRDDLIVVYTDGVTEAEGDRHELYGDDRLMDVVADRSATTGRAVADAILESVINYEGGEIRTDDVTVLTLSFVGSEHGARRIHDGCVISNRMEEIGRAIEAFEAFAERAQLPPKIVFKFNVALDEVLANVVSYAFDDDDAHTIRVIFERDAERLVVSVEDDGVPFNPTHLSSPDTTKSIEERDIGGLGIHLTRKLIDEVRYRRLVDRNVLTMIHHVGAEDDGAPPDESSGAHG